ncbi:hypothetical protein BDV11DRAFT_170585 [Aspergillus similis]
MANESKEDFLSNYEIVERFFNERLSESNPIHRNVKQLLGAARSRIPPCYKDWAWYDLAATYTRFLLKFRRQHPEKFEGFRTLEEWDKFVRQRAFLKLMHECFPAQPAGAGVGVSQRSGMTPTPGDPEPGRPVRVRTTGPAMFPRLRRLW